MQTVRRAEPPAESVVAPAERKQEFGGPMWLDDIDPELEVTPLLDSGTDCRAAHYMTAIGLWRPPIAPGIQGSLLVAAWSSARRLLPGDVSVSREAKLD